MGIISSTEPIWSYTNTKGRKGNNEPGCLSEFTEQIQNLFSYTCRQLLNYAFPWCRIISFLTSVDNQKFTGRGLWLFSVSNLNLQTYLQLPSTEYAFPVCIKCMSQTHTHAHPFIPYHGSEFKKAREKFISEPVT
jgi:hypothetical protein